MSKVMRTHTGITEWNGDFWCDSCGKRVRGITIVNGMNFCAKCYQETFGETEKDRKIADLEAKIAEKEKENNELEFIVEEIEQFAWEQLNNDNFDKYKAYDEMYTKIKQLTKNSPYEKQHQDKISFAIEQLEKVKECFIDGYAVCKNFSDLYWNFTEQIDNQINELKEMK